MKVRMTMSRIGESESDGYNSPNTSVHSVDSKADDARDKREGQREGQRGGQRHGQ